MRYIENIIITVLFFVFHIEICNTIFHTYIDWPEVAGNLRKARVTWGRLARIYGREGEDPKVSRKYCIAVTQQVLLFGAETWVLTRRMEAALDAVQGRVARHLTGRMPRRGRDGKWMYLPPGGSYQGSGDRESTDIGPPETEYGRAIHCDTTNSGNLRCDGAEGGDKGPPTMVGTARDRLEAGAGTGRKSDGSSRTRGRNYRYEDDDGDTSIGKGNGGGGVTGSQWLQWG